MAVKQNDIRIGSRDNPFLALDNSDIISINGNLACDLLCEQIPVDTLEIQCRYDRLNRIFAPSDYGGLQTADGMSFRSRETAGGVPEIPYATGLWYFNDDKYIGKFYVSDAKRTGKYVYTITAVSAMGVLDGMQYYGKIFLNGLLPEVLRDIILTDGLRDTSTQFLNDLHNSLVLSDGLDTVKVSGWIPSCTKREALHHVLFAQGLNIFKAENDAFLISRISASSVGDIDHKNVYDSGSVDLTDRVKLIEVTEHAFIPNPNAEGVVLYDNTEAAVDMEALVSFDSAPILVNTITATGSIKIKHISENCAIISGVGTLVGKPYAHTSQVLTRTKNSVIDGETVTVSDATLVNPLNSNAVADRLYAYYTQRKQIQLPIVLSGERCGMKYGCLSPYGDAIDAYIAAMAINASAIAKADCKMISGYVPPKGSGEFSHVVLLTGSGTFTVPEEVLNADNPRIRFVLIGGGEGGYKGENGEAGSSSVVQYRTNLAKPGKPGKNGQPGKIVTVQFNGSDVLSRFYYYCGIGGSGDGGYGPNTGGNTRLYSDKVWGTEIATSANGSMSDGGYLDILSGKRYGGLAPDYSYVQGGRGGGLTKYDVDEGQETLLFGPFAFYEPPQGGYYVVNKAISEITGYKIGSVQYADGGSIGGASHYWSGVNENEDCKYPGYFDGCPGGGPIVPGAANPSKMDGSPVSFLYHETLNELWIGSGGKGADGADAPSPMEISETAYGQGGIGGMGGGGGGGAGALNPNLDFSDYYVSGGNGGDGGKGGKGSDGAPGCILVYY